MPLQTKTVAQFQIKAGRSPRPRQLRSPRPRHLRRPRLKQLRGKTIKFGFFTFLSVYVPEPFRLGKPNQILIKDSVDPDERAVMSRLIRLFTVCHSVIEF